MSYGTVTIQDGVYLPSEPDRRFRSAPVRADIPAPAESNRLTPRGDLKTFEMELRYTQYKNIYFSGATLRLSEKVEYSKNIRRIASGSNPTRDLKRLVAQFSGCDEASKLRKRIIALSRIRNSISGETFRFGVEDP